MQKKIFSLSIFLFLYCSFTVMGQEVNVGKCTSNLSSAVSNNVSIDWYLPLAPKVGVIHSNNALIIRMDYQFRDDSRALGKSQRATVLVYAYNPANFTWSPQGSASERKGYEIWGKYDINGSLSINIPAWNSQTNVLKLRIEASAESGDKSKTQNGYIWIARNSNVLSNTAYYNWMCSRYDRAALYKEMANAWRAMANNPSGNDFTNAMNKIIDISKSFVNPTASDLGISLGIESVNLLSSGSALVTALGEINGILAQAISWINTSSQLLGPGLRDAIASAVSNYLTKDAVSYSSFLATKLDELANAVVADANEMKNLIYGYGSSSSWKSKMTEEKNKIISLLNYDIPAVRNTIASRLNLGDFGNIGYGVGSGVSSAAAAVGSKLNDFLNGLENQLRADKDLLEKMIR